MTRLGVWLRRAAERFASDAVPIWYHPDYRLPVAETGAARGIEPRRADFVAWYLVEVARVPEADLRRPERIGWAALARVHTAELLASLQRPEVLARVFAIDAAEVAVDAALETVRLACGGTVAATRAALARRGPAINLLGGFHHAGPGRAGALCAVDDVAVAVAQVRADGFSGRIVVIDLDAHPPDGLAECLAADRMVWIGSLGASDWGPLPGVDQVVLPVGCGDAAYLAALDRLLARMPAGALAFVLAGGDVLAGDPLGRLGLTLAGARRRDLRVAVALGRMPSVWLPGGGYHPDSWKLLAGTALALRTRSQAPIGEVDPLAVHFERVRGRLRREDLGDGELDLDGVVEELAGPRHAVERRGALLGLWTASGIEYALHEYGLLDQIARLGYRRPRVAVSRATAGDRFQLFGEGGGAEHLLAEVILERRAVAGGPPLLFINWMTLRHPLAAGRAGFVPLPGQEVPGLGLAREASELLLGMANRLDLPGVAFRPAHYHVAWAMRARFRFADAARQGRFVALQRDLAGVPLRDATAAIDAGRVELDGAAYAWEPDDMVFGPEPPPGWRAAADAERDRAHFALAGA